MSESDYIRSIRLEVSLLGGLLGFLGNLLRGGLLHNLLWCSLLWGGLLGDLLWGFLDWSCRDKKGKVRSSLSKKFSNVRAVIEDENERPDFFFQQEWC